MWRPAFPRPELVGAAAHLLPSLHDSAGRARKIGEGPQWEIVLSPGVPRVRTRDYAKAERTHERRPQAQITSTHASTPACRPPEPPPPPSFVR